MAHPSIQNVERHLHTHSMYYTSENRQEAMSDCELRLNKQLLEKVVHCLVEGALKGAMRNPWFTTNGFPIAGRCVSWKIPPRNG